VIALLHIIFGSRRPSPWQGPLRALRWVLLQLLPAWLCVGLCLASSAAAASDDAAPMCDPHGASVAAPTEVPEVDRGKLEELPCDELIRWVGVTIDFGDSHAPAVAHGNVPRPAPDLHLDREHLEGVLPIVILALPERAAPQSLQEPTVAGLPPREGHRNLVYRPPLFG
jgi:hypothetical protein